MTPSVCNIYLLEGLYTESLVAIIPILFPTFVILVSLHLVLQASYIFLVGKVGGRVKNTSGHYGQHSMPDTGM